MTDFNFDELTGVKGTDIGLRSTQWEYPGIGYHLTKGQLYLDGDKVDRLTVTVFEMAQWKNVTQGKLKNKRVVGSYHIKEQAANMTNGDGKENRVQIVMQVNDRLYFMGSGAQNVYGAWLKKGDRDSQYFAPDLERGIWWQIQDHIALAKTKTGENYPQYAWSFDIFPSKTEINTGGDYNQEIYPLKRGPFSFVGAEKMKANAELYVAEKLEEWSEKRCNPQGLITTSEQGTVETTQDYPKDFVPPQVDEEEDEIPF